MLESQLLPTFIDLDQTDFEAVAAVCQQYSLLPLVLLRVGYRTCRYLYPLLEKHPNLHLDISLFQAHGAIEEVCERFGPDRLLFATGLPVVAPGPAIAQVTYADISEEQKSLLAGGNLSRLLEAAYGN
jgi:predicted TIM-barrel fold metal-dependent hydrolase